MAKKLTDPNISELDELKVIAEMFRYYPLDSNGTLPSGTNQEITKALTSSKDTAIPYLPEDHPRINDNGELVDRWNSAYFFHALSSEQMEIRSAGPDAQMYTDDDLVYPKSEYINTPQPTFEKAVSIR